MKRISRDKSGHVNPLMESVVEVERETNARITVASGRKKRKNLMEGMIIETIMIF